MAGLNYISDALSVYYGSGNCLSMSYGAYQFWPTAATIPYLNISELERTVLGTTGSSTINVDASGEWSVSSDSAWLTVTKYSTSVRYTYSLAPSYSVRKGTLTFTLQGGAAVQKFVLTQDDSYEVYVQGGTSRTVSSAAGETTVTVISKHGSTYVPLKCNISNGWMHLKSEEHTYSGTYTYVFSYDTAIGLSSRSCMITFTQDNQFELSTQVSYTQQGRSDSISGFTTHSVYGEWRLGTYTSSYTDVGPYTRISVNVAAIVRKMPTSRNHETTYAFEYYNGAPAPLTSGTSIGTRTITSANTISIPSGDTCYGITIVGGPQLYITNVSGFTVN